MGLSRLISQLWPFDFISFLYHLLALAMDYLNLNRSSAVNPKSKQGAFEDLPPEIAVDILSRLPIRSVVSCKRVSKAWRNLIESRDFINVHHSNSAAGLVFLAGRDVFTRCKLFESDLDRHGSSYSPVAEFSLPFHGCVMLCGSSNGLIFLGDPSGISSDLYICNPVTCEYIKLESPCHDDSFYDYDPCVIIGFGASRTGEHKVVWITHDRSYDQLPAVLKCECQVYTLGTGSWRSIEAEGAQLYFNDRIPGVFVNGNLHWFAYNSLSSPLVSCFDLETELFSTFSLPANVDRIGRNMNLFASGNCLGLCDSNAEIVIWLMKEYGAERSWAKEFVISINPDSYIYDYGFPGELYDDEVYADDPYAVEPYADNPYADELYADEPFLDELYDEEPYADELYADEPYADEFYADEPYDDEFYDEEVYAADPYGNELYADEPYDDELYDEEVYADDPYGDELYADEPYDDELYDEEVYADDPYGDELYADEPYDDEVYADEPYDDEFYDEEVYADDPYDDELYVDEPYDDELYADEPYDDEFYDDELYDEEVYAADPYGDELYADDHYAAEPYFDEPYADELNADDPYVGDPYDDEFYADDLYGDGLYGDEPYADRPFPVYPIKIFENGDILMAWLDALVFCYSGKTKAIKRLPLFKQHSPGDCISPILHTPSFVSLKSLCGEGCNVRSF